MADRPRSTPVASPPLDRAIGWIRSDFNDVYRKAGADGAPFPLRDEMRNAFRARFLNGIKGLAPLIVVDPYQLSGNAFDAVAGEIKAEAARTLADRSVGDLDRGGAGLRRVDSIDEYSGARKTEWFGSEWFSSPADAAAPGC